MNIMKKYGIKRTLMFAALAVGIMGPLLLSGYILTLDLSWTPYITHDMADTHYGYKLFLYSLSHLIPSSWVEKLVLLGILILSGIGAHRMISRFATVASWVAVFAGVLYVVNPFVYTRFMAGQYIVLSGYALLPWFVTSLWSFLKNPGRRTGLILAAWTTAVGIVSLHSVFFIALIAIVSLVVAAFRSKHTHLRRKWLDYGTLAFGVALLASSYWVIPMMLGTSRQAEEISAFTSVDTRLYRTDGGLIGLPANVFALSGFWEDRMSRYELPWDMVGWWIVPAIVLIVLAAWGFYLSIRRRDRVGISLGIVALIAGVLALGDAWAPSAWMWHGLMKYVPFFSGYREPQKFVALVALGEVYLAASAIGWGTIKLKGKVGAAALVPLVFALPFALAPSMLWGMHGQLKSADYPSDWYALDSKLSHEAVRPKSLFLPWHGYMRLEFAGRVVANPASRFFATPMVGADTIDREGERLSSASQLVLERIIPAGQQGGDVSGLLHDAGFKYVVVSKTADYQDYSWIDRQSGIKLISDTKSLKLYEVNHE